MTDPAGVIFKDKLDARVAPERPKPKPPAAPASEAAAGQFDDPIVELVSQSMDMVVGLIEAQRQSFELKISRLETRLAEATGAIEVLKAKRGVRGPAGARGEPGAKIVSWRTNSFSFTATPVMSDGSSAADLDLREIVTVLAKRAVEAARQ